MDVKWQTGLTILGISIFYVAILLIPPMAKPPEYETVTISYVVPHMYVDEVRGPVYIGPQESPISTVNMRFYRHGEEKIFDVTINYRKK